MYGNTCQERSSITTMSSFQMSARKDLLVVSYEGMRVQIKSDRIDQIEIPSKLGRGLVLIIVAFKFIE
eukprot:scaffold7971_cov98-Skeletonema_menzelii.AAC.2